MALGSGFFGGTHPEAYLSDAMTTLDEKALDELRATSQVAQSPATHALC